MADPIRPGKQRRATARYMKADNSPGQIQDPPPWSLSDPALALLVIDPVDPFVCFVRHNSSTGLVTLSSGQVDGDIGEGVHPIGALTHEFSMEPPLGAIGGELEVGDEEDVPAG